MTQQPAPEGTAGAAQSRPAVATTTATGRAGDLGAAGPQDPAQSSSSAPGPFPEDRTGFDTDGGTATSREGRSWTRLGRGDTQDPGDGGGGRDWVNALVALGLGVALAAQNLLSPGVSWFLRLPALIAALLLGSQGLLALRVDPIPEPRDRVGDETPPHGAPGVAAGTENPSTGLLLVGLAIWLGVGALAIPTAPLMLSILSLVAAFLLFTEGLQSSRRTGG